MVHQQTRPPVQYAEKQLNTLEYKWYNTHDQQLDTAQMMWADWWQNGVYQQSPRKNISSGEDVCLEMV